jgi:hypothetical protein
MAVTQMKDGRSRRLEDSESRHRRPRDTCAVVGCRNTTTERKPYCLEHVEQTAYARMIAAEIEAREAEERRAARRRGWKLIDVNGTRAQEIAAYVDSVGGQTPKKLAAIFELDLCVLEAYLKALEQAGFLKTVKIPSKRYGLLPVVVAGALAG